MKMLNIQTPQTVRDYIESKYCSKKSGFLWSPWQASDTLYYVGSFDRQRRLISNRKPSPFIWDCISDVVVKSDLKRPWLSTELPVNNPYICKCAFNSYAMGGEEQEKEPQIQGHSGKLLTLMPLNPSEVLASWPRSRKVLELYLSFQQVSRQLLKGHSLHLSEGLKPDMVSLMHYSP